MRLEEISVAFQRCCRELQRVSGAKQGYSRGSQSFSWAFHGVSGCFKGVLGQFQGVSEGARGVPWSAGNYRRFQVCLMRLQGFHRRFSGFQEVSWDHRGLKGSHVHSRSLPRGTVVLQVVSEGPKGVPGVL